MVETAYVPPGADPSVIWQTEYWSGLDLGQQRDPSVLIGIRVTKPVAPERGIRVATDPAMGQLTTVVEANQARLEKEIKAYKKAMKLRRYDVVGIRRWDLGAPYPKIVSATTELFCKQPLKGSNLVIDATGVGRPVVDMFNDARSSGLKCENCNGNGITEEKSYLAAVVPCIRCDGTGKMRLRASIRPVTITAGSGWSVDGNGWRVSKKEIVSALQVLLQSDRLKFERSIRLTEVLTKELEMFKIKVSTSANETFECLVAGTLVETARGGIPIERVNPGDLVATRGGYRKVMWSGPTKTVSSLTSVGFNDGSRLVGTGDHLVFTSNRGWVELRGLTCQDLCIRRPMTVVGAFTPRSLYSRVGSTIEHQATHITSPLSTGRGRNSIGRSGNFTMVKSPTDTISTTKMETGITTTFLTSRALATAITKRHTIREKPTLLKSALLVAKSLLAPLTAALMKKVCVVKGTPTVPCHVPKETEQSGGSSVSNAARNLRSSSMAKRECCGTALPNAKTPICTEIVPDQPSSVFGVETISGQPQSRPNTVRVSALPVTVQLETPVTVYDLIVEDYHEFFANGILVHNSWRERDHDDMVLGLGIACWASERGAQQLWLM